MASFKSCEVFDYLKASKILDNWDEIQFKSDKKIDWITERIKLEKYLATCTFRDNIGLRPVVYHYARNKVGHSRQSVYIVGLQNLPRTIRQTITNDFYYDIDTVNSQPSILLNICQKYKYPCDAIKYYVDNRQKCLDELMKYPITTDHEKVTYLSKMEAKQVPISIINGKTFDYNIKWIKDFQKDVRHFHDELGSNIAFEPITKMIKTKSKKNILGKIANYVLLDIENTILTTIISFLKKRKISIERIVLVFDGIMIPKKDATIDDKFLEELNLFVKENTSYDVKFLLKPMTEMLDLSKFPDPQLDSPLIQEIKATKGATRPLALLIHDKFPNDFVSVKLEAGGKSDWYYFNGIRWVEDPSATELSSRITNQIAPMFEGNSKILKKLLNNGSRQDVINECARIYYDKEFMEKIDTDFTLLGFNNGIYDIKEGKLRQGQPQDYVSKSVGYDYEEFEEDDQHIIDTFTLFAQIYPQEKQSKENFQLFEVVLLILSACLFGGHLQQLFYIFTGTGSNGKSLLFSLLKLALGEYISLLDSNYFTQKQKNNSSAPQPELASLRGCRCVYSFEPEEDTIFQMGSVKRLTGGDTIRTRDVYGKLFNYNPIFTLFFICNKVPTLPAKTTDKDYATWRRMRVIPHEETFKENPDPNNPHEHPIDKTLEEKLKDLKVPFMCILVNYGKDYFNNKMIPQLKIMEQALNEYKLSTNPLTDFIEDEIEETIDEDNFGLSLADLWFKYLKSKRYNKQMTKKLFKTQLISRFGVDNFMEDRKIVVNNSVTQRGKNIFTTLKWIDNSDNDETSGPSNQVPPPQLENVV